MQHNDPAATELHPAYQRAAERPGLAAFHRDLDATQLASILRQLKRAYTDSYGAATGVEWLPQTQQVVRAGERLADAMVALEDAQSALEHWNRDDELRDFERRDAIDRDCQDCREEGK